MNPLRTVKQLFILFVFLSVCLLIGLVVYKNSPTQPVPTPTPSTEVAALEISQTNLFATGATSYDLLLRVRNPNNNVGYSSVNYQVQAFNASNGLIGTKEGTFFIVPGQSRYLVINGLDFGQKVDHIGQVTFTKAVQQQLTTAASRADKLSVGATQFQKDPQSVYYGSVIGSVTNNADYDLGSAEINIIVEDQNQNPIAINKAVIQQFKAHTTRTFQVYWSRPFSGSISQITTEPVVNLMDANNFFLDTGN